MNHRHLVLLAVAALLAIAPPAHGFNLVPLPGAYQSPVHVSGPPGDATRVLVVERGGTIELVKNGLAPTTYLDIADKVQAGGEEGLLSMAFASTTRFYVFYTAGSGTESELVVEAYDVAADGDTADEASADEVIRIPHPVGSNHNGGQLQIGPDGNLWISTGDGGGTAGDSDGDAQDLNRLLGKILRIAPGADGGYTIPAGNPYAAGGGAPEVWASGLRNPWRFSFDRGTGDLFVGDVGEGTMEEIDRAAATELGCGANFGWPWFEGTYVLGSGSPPSSHHAPLFTHRRSDGWQAIVGGYVIRDAGLGADVGKYVYGDFFVEELWLYDPATGTRSATDDPVPMLSGFGEDGVGRVHATSLGGTVYRLVDETTGLNGEAPPRTTFSPPGCQPRPDVAAPTDPPPPEQEPAPAPVAGPVTGPTPLPPSLRVFAVAPRRQRAVRRRSVLVRVGCDIACTLRATGRLTIGRARLRLRGRSVALAAGARPMLRLRLGRRTLRIARRGLRRGRRVRALLTVTGVAGNGATARRTLTVRVVR